jgi:hypothetical protein
MHSRNPADVSQVRSHRGMTGLVSAETSDAIARNVSAETPWLSLPAAWRTARRPVRGRRVWVESAVLVLLIGGNTRLY